MLNTIIKILIALLVFSLIVIIHELGHFLLAKKNNIGVTEFSVGMGPRIFSIQKGETKYSLKVLPIGGSCMMVGEMEEDDSENSFQKKSVWARISVVLAGPIFNFILAFLLALIYIGYSGWDVAYVTNVVDDMPAKESGLQKNDIITSVNGYSIWCKRDLSIAMSYGDIFNVDEDKDGVKTYKPVTMDVDRDGEKKTIEIVPKTTTEYHFSGVDFDKKDYRILTKVEEGGCIEKAGLKVGDKIVKLNGKDVKTSEDFVHEYNHAEFKENISLSYERDGKVHKIKKMKLDKKATRPMMGFSYDSDSEKQNALQVIKYAFVDTGFWIKTTVRSLGWLIKGKVQKEDMSGVVGIVDVIGESYESSKEFGFAVTAVNLIFIAILLSANLGVMNLIPFPALDGGRFVFLLFEAITKKKVKQEVEGIVNLVGFVLLMVLMVFVTWNDISKIIHG